MFTYNSDAIEGNTLHLREMDMEQLLASYAVSTGHGHIVAKLARVHIEFEGIQPFIDGNGPGTVVNRELMKAGYPPVDIKFTDRLAYYNAFDECHVKHNLSVMERLFAGYINMELGMYLAMLQD